MPHPTCYGLTQEKGALVLLATDFLTDLGKRSVTRILLDKYATDTGTMEDVAAAARGTTSDKEQLTDREVAAREELLLDITRIQRGVKRAFQTGSPVRKEFFIGEKHNFSTARLTLWARSIATSWPKYSADLISKGGLIQGDTDTMVANAAILSDVDSKQEIAKHSDAPEANAEVQKAMAVVEADADYIYGAAEAEYAKNPEVLGRFEALKPLRFSTPPRPKNPPSNPS